MPVGAPTYKVGKRSTPIRVVQCFTGGVGSECVRRIVDHPDLTLVGVLVHSADKDGKDAGELVGIGPIGISATRDLDQIIALHPDAAIWHRQATSHADRQAPGRGRSTSTPRWAATTWLASPNKSCSSGRAAPAAPHSRRPATYPG